MSTTPNLSEEQLFLQGLDALPEPGVTQQPPPLPNPKVKVGEKEYSLEDLAQLLTTQGEELKRLKALGNLPEPEPHQPEPPQIVTPPTGPKPTRWDAATWANKTAQDPISAQDHALGQALGLPEGVPASAALSQLTAMVVGLKQELAGQTQKTQAEILQREAERFVEQNKEYEATPENAAVLERYASVAGPVRSAAVYGMAYAKAVADGAIKPRAKQVTSLSSQQVTEGQNRLPSLRGNQGSGEGSEPSDFASIKAKLDGMSPQAVDAYIAKFERGLGSRK